MVILWPYLCVNKYKHIMGNKRRSAQVIAPVLVTGTRHCPKVVSLRSVPHTEESGFLVYVPLQEAST